MAKTYLGGSGNSLTFWISVAASTVLVFYGYDQGVFGNVIVGESFLQTMGNPSASLQGHLVSVFNLGCFAGALSCTVLGDILGRPRTLLAGSTIVAVGALIQATCYSLPQMFISRVITGFGTGMNTSTAGIWQSETCKIRRRGKLIAIQMASCAFGLMMSNWLTLGFSFMNSSVSWRFPLAFQIVFTAAVWAMCPFLPDSPRLLIRKGRHEEALQVLAALEGHQATPSSATVRQQFDIIKDILDREHMNTYTWWQLISGRGPAGVVRRIILGAWMQAANQLCGINIIAYYMTYVFIHALKFSNIRARVLSGAVTVDFFIVSILSYFVIERYGRRSIMLWSSLGLSLSWIVIAIALALSEIHPASSSPLGIVATTFFFVVFAVFGVGFDPVTWVYPAEINALEMRTKGAGLALASNWILNYMIAVVTPIGIANIHWKFWTIWGIICAGFIPIVYFFYPETANRSLEDIDRFFETKPGLLLHRNKIATQYSRPQVYEDTDAAILEMEMDLNRPEKGQVSKIVSLHMESA